LSIWILDDSVKPYDCKSRGRILFYIVWKSLPFYSIFHNLHFLIFFHIIYKYFPFFSFRISDVFLALSYNWLFLSLVISLKFSYSSRFYDMFPKYTEMFLECLAKDIYLWAFSLQRLHAFSQERSLNTECYNNVLSVISQEFVKEPGEFTRYSFGFFLYKRG